MIPSGIMIILIIWVCLGHHRGACAMGGLEENQKRFFGPVYLREHQSTMSQ